MQKKKEPMVYKHCYLPEELFFRSDLFDWARKRETERRLASVNEWISEWPHFRDELSLVCYH